MNPQEIKQILEKASGICLRKPMTSSEYELLLIKMTWERAIKKAEQFKKELDELQEAYDIAMKEIARLRAKLYGESKC